MDGFDEKRDPNGRHAIPDAVGSETFRGRPSQDGRGTDSGFANAGASSQQTTTIEGYLQPPKREGLLSRLGRRVREVIRALLAPMLYITRWFRSRFGLLPRYEDPAARLKALRIAESFSREYLRRHPPEKAGWKDGRAHYPPAGATRDEMSAYERIALASYQSKLEGVRELIQYDIDQLTGTLSGPLLDLSPRILGEQTTTDARIQSEVLGAVPELQRADALVNRAMGDAGEHYARLGLGIPVVFTPMTPLSRVIAVLMLFGLGEALPTAWALKDAVAGGWSGAVMWGAIVSVFNLGVAFFVGIEVGPWAKSPFRWTRILGRIAIASYMTAELLLQWGIAAWRFLVREDSATPDTVASYVGHRLVANPFFWCGDLFSWMLFVAGCIFAWAAFKKGFHSALSKLDRDVLAARARFDALQDTLHARCRAHEAAALAGLEALEQHALAERATRFAACDELVRLVRAYRTEESAFHRGLHELRIAYWRAQMQTRGTVPMPAYAHLPLSLDGQLSDLDPGALLTGKKHWDQWFNASRAAIVTARSQITLRMQEVFDAVVAKVVRARGEPRMHPDGVPLERPHPWQTGLGSGAPPIIPPDDENAGDN